MKFGRYEAMQIRKLEKAAQEEYNNSSPGCITWQMMLIDTERQLLTMKRRWNKW